MARIEDGDAWWEPISAPCPGCDLCEDGYDHSEYEVVGSIPLTIWDIMLMRAERVSGSVNIEMEYLRCP